MSSVGGLSEEESAAIRSIKESPVKFCIGVLGLTPFKYQAKFLDDKSKRIIACAGRQVGKSVITAARALWFALANPKTMTLIVSSTQRQSSLMFDKILGYVESSSLVKGSVKRSTRTMIRFSNGSEMHALPCGRYGNSLRGYTAHLIIVDEAAFVPEEVITEVVMPMLSTTDGTAILISTPYDKSHVFYRCFNSPRWSKYRFRTADNPLVKKEFLEEQREEAGELRFRQEYEAEFVDDEDTYFPTALLRSAVHVCEGNSCEYCLIVSGKKEPSGSLYAGYDPGGMTDPAALVVVEKVVSSGKPVFKVVMMKTLLASKENGRRLSGNEAANVYTQFTVGIADLHQKLGFKKLVVDSTGLGSPIVEHCRDLKLPVEGVSLGRGKQEEILSNLKILLEQGKVVLPDEMELLSSLNCVVSHRNRVGGYAFDHAKGTHDDLAYALALAVWGAGKGGTVIMMIR